MSETVKPKDRQRSPRFGVRRNPLEVTSDRIAEHIDRYYDNLAGWERDTLSRARVILEDIAEASK